MTSDTCKDIADVQRYRQTLTEVDLQRAVVTMARTLGWSAYHTTFALGSGRGFPDLLLIKPPRLIVAELKGPRGKLRPGQQEWLDLFAACGVEAYLWTVEAWTSGAVEHVLRGEGGEDATDG